MNAPDPKRRPIAPATPYDRDFHGWTVEQAALLAARRAEALDWNHLAEEIASLGRSEKREIENRLSFLIQHLLKWRHQPDRQSGNWRATIIEQRRRIARELSDSPSLRGYPAEVLAVEYEIARARAAAETGLPDEAFPAKCPFTIGQILDLDFLPD